MGREPENGLLGAEEVGRLVGVKETTVYRWCKEGKLPCLKVGRRWRIRREALEEFLKRSEHPVTLAGQLDSFLREPDSVLAIAQNLDILHRLDAAFLRVGESRGGRFWRSSTPGRGARERNCRPPSRSTASRPPAWSARGACL